MEIQIVSDLHIDFVQSPVRRWRQIIEPTAPYLAILGDTGELKNINLYRLFIEALAPHWKQIILINGNHEFYGYKPCHNKQKLLKKQKTLLSKFDNVHLLENSYIDLDGVRFIGSVLWSHVPKKAVNDVEWYVNDYRSIYTHKRKIDTDITNEWHKTAVEYIHKTITESSLPVVVLTHHAPLMHGTSPPQFEESKDPDQQMTNHGFATNLESLFKENVKLWAFGHTHWCCDFEHRGVRVYSNARGYDEDKKYQKDHVIKIE